MEKELIGIIDLNEAKELAVKLAEKEIYIEMKHNEKTCVKGCAVKVEIWAEHDDIPAIAETIRDEKMKVLDNEGLDIDKSLLDHVFDDEAKTAICPACGTSFSTELKECPECGLVFIP
jgi:uncharacterized OB-fold protein